MPTLKQANIQMQSEPLRLTLLNIFISITLMLTLSGCSLLDIKIENLSEPLTDKEMATRSLTRGFLPTYFEKVEAVSDKVIDNSDVKKERVAALYWKINTENTAVGAALKSDPEIAMVDFALLTAQQRHFFSQPEATEYFGKFTPELLKVSEELDDQLLDIAKSVMSDAAYQKMEGFIAEQIKNQPNQNFFFERGDIALAWYKYNQVPLESVSSNTGSLPQIMVDMSDRVHYGGAQAGKTLEWKLKMLSETSDLNESQVASLMKSIERTSNQLAKLTELSPEQMKMLGGALREELQPLADGLDEQLALFQQALSNERLALTSALNDQRVALGVMVNDQRVQIMQDLQRIAKETIEAIIPQIRSTLVIVIIALLVFILVLFALPFYLGYVIGRYKGRAIPESSGS